MKTIRTIIIAAGMMAAAAINGWAQPKEDGNWKDRMKSEQVAFITTELNLTPEEAQTFWPVYNQASEKRFEAMKTEMEAMKALDEAVKSGEGNFTSLLNDYLKASENRDKVDMETAASIRKAVGDEKAAKLVVAEEKFRRQQIHRLGGGPRPDEQAGEGHHGPRPDGGMRDGQRPEGHGPRGGWGQRPEETKE